MAPRKTKQLKVLINILNYTPQRGIIMRISADASLRFSLKEAAVLSRLPEDKLRREVERKVIAPSHVPTGATHRLEFAESEILYFAMLHAFADKAELTPRMRRRAWRLLVDWSDRAPAERAGRWTTVYRGGRLRDAWVTSLSRGWSETISPILTVNWDALIEDVGPRLDLYRRGLERLEENEEVLGGEPVFKGTRLSVRHIGRMRAKGEPVERIIEDYPYLSAEDVEFARLYAEAHPIVGRPSASTASA
jgi:uncharacterized protein (DUF433 family)